MTTTYNKKNHPITPKQVVTVVDLGYLGVEKDLPEQQYHPYQSKKSKSWKLSQEEKEHNKNHSIQIIVIESIIFAD